jgi:hypothetical protein
MNPLNAELERPPGVDTYSRRAPMSKLVWWLIAISGMWLVALIMYSALAPLPNLQLPPPRAAEEPAASESAPARAEPEIRYPIEQPAGERPLPALDTSDATMRNAVNELLPDKTLVDLFQVHDFVRHIVATVDNIPRKKLAQRLLPNKPAAGKFAVSDNCDTLAIDPRNTIRYAPYLRLLNALDTEKSVALYVRFYPLFQQAYRDLGYPKGYFNDRLIEAIDHLLATPDVKGPIKVVRPKVLYEYADPELEALSAGQKALIRTGSENAAQIKAKLREVREELLRQVRADARTAQKAN